MGRMGNAVGGLFHSIGLLLLRLGFGGLMIYGHGWGKLANFAEVSSKFPDPFGLGGKVTLGMVIGAEVVCAGLVVLGLATRIATVPLVITMGFAAIVVHASDTFDMKERALLYLCAFLTLLLTGPGTFSVDALFVRRRHKKAS